jgi:PPOX class probable F420-dependent enzyme
MPHKMTQAEAWHFLESGQMTATFASVRADGSPHAVPTWYAVDGDEIVFTTGETTVKAANIRERPEVVVVVQDPRPPYNYVSVEGEARLVDDLVECRAISTQLGAKYMGADRAEEFGKRNGVPGELVVRVRPTKVFGEANVAGTGDT